MLRGNDFGALWWQFDWMLNLQNNIHYIWMFWDRLGRSLTDHMIMNISTNDPAEMVYFMYT